MLHADRWDAGAALMQVAESERVARADGCRQVGRQLRGAWGLPRCGGEDQERAAVHDRHATAVTLRAGNLVRRPPRLRCHCIAMSAEHFATQDSQRIDGGCKESMVGAKNRWWVQRIDGGCSGEYLDL
jgi:hypothetical protein